MESIVAPITMLVVVSTYEHQTFICIYCRVESICQGVLLPNFLRIMVVDMLDIGKHLMFSATIGESLIVILRRRSVVSVNKKP